MRYKNVIYFLFLCILRSRRTPTINCQERVIILEISTDKTTGIDKKNYESLSTRY